MQLTLATFVARRSIWDRVTGGLVLKRVAQKWLGTLIASVAYAAPHDLYTSSTCHKIDIHNVYL